MLESIFKIKISPLKSETKSLSLSLFLSLSLSLSLSKHSIWSFIEELLKIVLTIPVFGF